MNGSWSSPSLTETSLNYIETIKSVPGSDEKYYALIVDSGAIIKHSGFSSLHNVAQHYVTVQGVMDEIRDSKARQHIETLPFKLEVRSPTAEGISRVVEFSKKTGDYASLSSVDIQVLALHYDMEKEGCRNKIEHIRNEPKRALTGRVVPLNQNLHDELNGSEMKISENDISNGEDFFCNHLGDEEDSQSYDSDSTSDEVLTNEHKEESDIQTTKPKSWASLLNPASVVPSPALPETVQVSDIAVTQSFGSMKLCMKTEIDNLNGQFSDAEEETSIDIPIVHDSESSDDDDEFASIGDDFSDEECDIYILDPDEVEERKRNAGLFSPIPDMKQDEIETINELDAEFPCLSGSTVPHDRRDDNHNTTSVSNVEKLKNAKDMEEQRKKDALKPLSNSGKLYNSFKKYSDIVSSSGVKLLQTKGGETKEKEQFSIQNEHSEQSLNNLKSDKIPSNTIQSRIIGVSDQSNEIEDDGEGWISSTNDIISMKAAGNLDPFGADDHKSDAFKSQLNLPSKSQRAACATTDFAMQNVILQMNLELLSINGVKIRKLKSWVSRCSACFHIYTGEDKKGKRLFCSKCGSSSLQRIAASVDSKTGRLKLHFKKNYTYNKRGTQFALPKPGTQNRFMGDLLLAEDQLLYGALGQRARTSRGNKAAQSLFGSDITTSVGCDLSKRSDIKVGLGRKNPNSAAVGRERRGKKKKGVNDKACGLRRY